MPAGGRYRRTPWPAAHVPNFGFRGSRRGACEIDAKRSDNQSERGTDDELPHTLNVIVKTSLGSQVLAFSTQRADGFC